jgi:excisionase family DNA binding protein
MLGVDTKAQDHYTTPQAAKILKVSDRYVRKLINAGDLEAVQDEKGRHHIPQRAVHALLESRRLEATESAATPPPAHDVVLPASQELLGVREEAATLRRRVQDLMRELGRLEGRIELTERAQSSVEDERDRLIGQLEAEREERQRLQERVEDLSRPWYRRWFR